ncbi:trypsin-like serine peptidase [Candidatus Bipolaricaulota bacterium]
MEIEEEMVASPATEALYASDLPRGLAQSVQRNSDEVVELSRLLRLPEQAQDGCAECKSLQVSVQRDVPDFPSETWRHIPEDKGPGSWRIVIHSPEAVFVRAQVGAELTEEPLEFFFYGATGAKSVERPFSSNDLDRTGGWGPIIEGEYLCIEVITGSSTSPPPLVIPQISHGYLPIPPSQRVGSCNNDVTCSPDWSDVSRAVARIYFQFGWGGWICTGSLLADTDPTTQRLWFLTAQHCVSSDADADTLIAFFDYRTDTCDGSMPSLGDANLAYGSDYIVGSTTSDFTLLELDENPPGYQTFLGWSTGDLATGEDIVTVHHPGGSYQRITFGDENGTGVGYPYWNDFWRVVYNSGTTEGGSSGAPLFDEAGKYVRGQLWGGNTSCSYMSGIDLFGKFGTSWDLGLSTYLLDTTTPPEPETVTWDTPPHAAGPDAIEMKATTATDPSGVEYSFEETSGNVGGTDSGWQDDPEYTDDGLQTSALYCYRVKTRDTSPILSETGWSSAECSSRGIRGDIDGDRSLDLIDVLMLYRYVEGVLPLPPDAVARADVDEDGDVDTDDAQALADLVFAP